ncbi:hypothetical protein ZEAMMB73_Zm00001d051079 [Zea mays]|uniref:Uncharacterized protein n=1 Tax=Zea mays TaxID=4577 RepID=A0A1D6Q4V3_MAIZE|nr:hypothetical protein ZEAMMB73_Zm00001d051079 [Zea mays]
MKRSHHHSSSFLVQAPCLLSLSLRPLQGAVTLLAWHWRPPRSRLSYFAPSFLKSMAMSLGTAVALLMGEICSVCHLQDIIGPPSSLSDEGLEDPLEGYPKDILMYLVLAKIMKPLLIGSP